MWDDTRIKKHLQDRLIMLEQRLEEIEGGLRQPEDSDLEEQALHLDDHGVLETLARLNSMEIASIREALKRMDDGSYGNCAFCDRPIGRRRLSVLPQATACVRCARLAA